MTKIKDQTLPLPTTLEARNQVISVFNFNATWADSRIGDKLQCAIQGAVNLGRTFQSYAMCETAYKKVCGFGKSNQTCPLNLEYYSI